MTRLVRLVLGLAGLVVIVAFAIANRTPVDVSFAPFPVLLELPVYGVFLLGLVLGALIGGSVVWLGGHGYRRDARRMRHRVWALEHQLEVQKKQERSAEAEAYSAHRGMVTQGAPG
ncbi:MAG: lipopolysaccharide assembly protein LapA domain-containing protein [Geminicoccaceae bacterium]